MIKNDNHLKMTFYLKQGEDFLCENEVVTALKAGKKLPISATNTDGAISIVYQGQELLGIEYWDEIFWAMFDLIYNYSSFKEKKLSTFFPMQSCWLILHREGYHIKYQFKSAVDKRQIDIQAIIPFDLFTHEFSLVIWRMIKLLNYLGVRRDDMLANWENVPLSKVAQAHVDQIREIVEADLDQLGKIIANNQ